MKSLTDPRHIARKLALIYLFEKEYNKHPSTDFHIKDCDGLNTPNSDQILYFNLINGVNSNKEKIDSIIKEYAPLRPLDQISKIDLQLLRIAIYEGFIGKITPPKVVIDEVIELGKEYSTENASKFINGVLGKLFNNIANEPKRD